MKFLLLTGFLSLILTLQGQTTVTLTPSKDNTLIEDSTGSKSNGMGQFIFAGRVGLDTFSIRRALLAFPIADSIPAGAVIDSVSLIMHMAKTSSGPSDISLHRVLANWGEGVSVATGGGGVNAEKGDATWFVPFFDSTLTWTNPGGDFDTTTSAHTIVDSVGTFTWFDSLMVVDVQSWLDSAEGNFGWIMIGNEVEKSSKSFASKDHTNATLRPKLEITYSMASSVTPSGILPLKVYPNPVQDKAMIQLPEAGVASVRLLDAYGKLIQTIETHSGNIELKLQGLAAGVYWIRLEQSAKTYGTKILKL